MRRLACVAGLLAGALLTASAQTPAKRPPLPNEQWVQLFNGKDLTNWVEVGKEKWTIEDGTIHGQGVTNAYGYLRTEKKYKDFWLSMRFKCEADGNSGVYFHTEFKAGTVECQPASSSRSTARSNHHTGGLYGDGRNWFAWPSPEHEHVIRPTDWNDMLLKVEGNHMVAILNGITGARLHRPVAAARRTATSRCSCTPAVSATCGSRTSSSAICRCGSRARSIGRSEGEAGRNLTCGHARCFRSRCSVWRSRRSTPSTRRRVPRRASRRCSTARI